MKPISTLLCLAIFFAPNICCGMKLPGNESINIISDPMTQDSHLPNKALRVLNISPNPIRIKKITLPIFPLGNNLVKYYSATTTSCTIDTTLAPNASCNLWFQAAAIGKTKSPQEFAVTIDTDNQSITKHFQIQYEQDLFVGGRFNYAENTTYGVFKWDGMNWFALPAIKFGDYDDTVMALASNDNYLYAGGSFPSYIARIALDNNSTWQLIPGLKDAPKTLINYSGQIYAGGEFSGSFRLALQNKWEQVGNFENGVGQYTIYHNNLYAAGQFKDKVICLNPDKNSWRKIGTNLTSDDNEILIPLNNTLYTGGHLNTAKLYKCPLIGPQTWTAIATSAPYQTSVLSAATMQNQLYIGTMNGLFQLVNNELQPVLPPTASYARINSLLSLDDNLLVASNIDDHSGTLNWLAMWHNNSWQQIAPQEWDEINPEINALLAVPTWNIINKT